VKEMAVAKKELTELHIERLKQGRLTLRIIGTTPMYFNSMSVKAKRDLLLGGGRKTKAERANIKHHPLQEFRDSLYRKNYGDTLLCFPAPGVKGAMATAALATAGISKVDVQRLIFLPEANIQIWGTPYLKMDVVRSADINKTPDIRTRAYLPRWCAEISVAYVMPTLNAHSIASILTNAGTIIGIGDFRQEKGKGSNGCFNVMGSDETSPLWDELMKEGRDVQQAAFDNPTAADTDTEELLEFYRSEVMRRAA
jgi:hypothetical protein